MLGSLKRLFLRYFYHTKECFWRSCRAWNRARDLVFQAPKSWSWVYCD